MLPGFFQASKRPCHSRGFDNPSQAVTPKSDETSKQGAGSSVLAPVRFDFSRHTATVSPEGGAAPEVAARASRALHGGEENVPPLTNNRTSSMTASEAVGVSAPLFGSCSQGAERGRPAALNTHLKKPCHLAASNSHGHAVGEMGTVPIVPEQGSTCLSLRAGEPQAPGSPCDEASAEGGKGRGVDQASVHVQHPGLSMEDQEYLLSAAFVEDFGGTQEEGLQVPSALEPPGSNELCDIHAVSCSSEPWRGMSTDGALQYAEDVEIGGPLRSPSIDHVDHGPVASVPTGLPMPEEDEWAALAQACACASPYKPPDAHAPPFRAAPQTQARAGGSQVELCWHPPLAPEASAHAPSPWHPVQRKDDQDMQQRQANAGMHSISRADHIGAAATQGWERGAEPCKDFVYRQAGAGPHAGAGRGARGGLGIWGRKKGMKRPFYLSLRGDKVVGSDAVKQSREDAEAVARGQTFTHLRGELSLAQRTRLEHAPSPSPECSARHLGFAAWGLPEEVVRSYEERGVRELFDWQVECLQAGNGRVLSGGNLVYSAPTSGGKTMVAELLMLRALTLREEGTALFVVPFIALAEEKARYFRRMWGALNLGVKSFHSEAGDASLGPDVHVAVCTIERANALVNQLLELGELRRLSIVVVDELHMIGDDHRGYLIEVMLAKLRLASTPQYQQQQQQGNNTALLQIVGLSATLPNLPQLAHWLAADLYVTDFRPVALTHYLLVDDALWQHLGTGTWQLARHLPPAPRDAETQRLLQLCQETVSDGDGVLVFCNSRRRTQNCAERIAEGLLPPPDREVLRRALVEKLRDCPVGLPAELQRLVGRGVAFHHAGMTMEERGLLEDGFRSGALCVLVATSTLAAGVNLPARRVIIRSRMQGSTEMDLAQFQQMCGRAGRLGLDKQGEAILMTTARDSAASKAFIQRSLPPMRSVLREAPGKGGITRAVLEVAAARMACSRDWLHTFMQCTLLAQQVDPAELECDFEAALSYLLAQRFLTPVPAPQPGRPQLETTQLGVATFFSSMAPQDATLALADMQAASGGLVLSSDLHLLFLTIPASRWYFAPPYDHLCRAYGNWPHEVHDVAERVGLSQALLDRARHRALGGQGRWGAPAASHEDQLAVRFVNAVALHEKLQEVPLIRLPPGAVDRGTLQRLQSDAAMYCGMLVCFCRKLKWDTLATLFAALQERLAHGAPEELLPLMRLGSDLMHTRRARALFDAGLTHPQLLSQASATDVALVLKKARPFTTLETTARQPPMGGDVGGQATANPHGWCMADGTARRMAQEIVQRSREAVRRELEFAATTVHSSQLSAGPDNHPS